MSIGSSVAEDWAHAAFMPSMDSDLKIIVAAPFNIGTYTRLGLLQARARRLGW